MGFDYGQVHNGSFGHKNLQYARIVFHQPSAQLHLHNVIFKGPAGTTNYSALVLNPVTFCNDVLDAVAQWLDAKKDDPVVKTNISRVVPVVSRGALLKTVYKYSAVFSRC